MPSLPVLLIRISIHAPAKGATATRLCTRSLRHNFNPRSREGSDHLMQCRVYQKAPFQSTLPRRERRTCTDAYGKVDDFNPRSREGSDFLTHSKPERCTYFNPRSREGSDAKQSMMPCRSFSFQSTLPRRERLKSPTSGGFVFPFQSTLPRRERLPRCVHSYYKHYFNPRSREGSDRSYAFGYCMYLISIHAPAKGATLLLVGFSQKQLISIHAPAKGATGDYVYVYDKDLDFNPRSREGSDLIRL